MHSSGMKNKVSLVSLFCFTTLIAVAQHKNVEIGTLGEGKQSIPAVVISGKDAKFVTVKGAGKTFYLSSDHGATWESAMVDGFDQAESMSLLSNGSTLHATYAMPHDNHFRVFTAQSKDNGKTWTTPVSISPVANGEQKYPSSALDTKGNMYVTWTEKITGTDGKCASVIMLSTSSNGGKWSKPVRMSQAGGECEEDNKLVTGAVPAVGPDGKMFVSWCNYDKIYMDRSFGSNMWLENDISVNTITPGWKQNVSGYSYVTSPPQLLVDQSKGNYHGCIYLTWADQKSGEGDTDVWFTRSNNHGDNWSSPIKLGTTTAQSEQYGPRMAIDQVTGYIFVLFYDRGEHEDDQTDVILAYTSESGGSFKTIKISESSFMADDKSGAGVYLDIAAHAGIIIPVWTRTQDGITSLWATTVRQDELIKPAETKAKKKK
jgi:hypothetical protein